MLSIKPKTFLQKYIRSLLYVSLSMHIALVGCQVAVSEKQENKTEAMQDGNVIIDDVKVDTSGAPYTSMFGIQFNGMPFHRSAEYGSLDIEKHLRELPILVRSAKQLGVKWARVSVDWSAVEDNAGEMHWELIVRLHR